MECSDTATRGDVGDDPVKGEKSGSCGNAGANDQVEMLCSALLRRGSSRIRRSDSTSRAPACRAQVAELRPGPGHYWLELRER